LCTSFRRWVFMILPWQEKLSGVFTLRFFVHLPSKHLSLLDTRCKTRGTFAHLGFCVFNIHNSFFWFLCWLSFYAFLIVMIVSEAPSCCRYIFYLETNSRQKGCRLIRASDSLFNKGIVIGYLYFSPLDVFYKHKWLKKTQLF
jgi:hypothetical protein